jgi:quinol monooxygenase YgiN
MQVKLTRLVLGFGLGLSLALARVAARAEDAPPPQGPYESFIYVEVAPTKTSEAIKALKDYRDATRKENGAAFAAVYEEVGTPSRFVTQDIWTDYGASQTHAKGPAVAALVDRLRPIEFGPPYTRAHSVYSTAGDAQAGAVLVVTHLDVGPASLAKLLPLLMPFAEAAAKDPGMLRFEILRQGPEQNNHFRLREIWDSKKDWEAHNMAAATQDFRNAIAPLLGTPYDQRSYSLLK